MAKKPQTMQAMILTGHGGLDKLQFQEDWPVPAPEAGEVLIRVHACGMNNTDINTRTAWYSKSVTDATTCGELHNADDDDAAWGGTPIQFPLIQGADVVGTVEAVGEQADAGLIGKRVMIDTWLRDWDDPLNGYKTGYFGSECNGGYAQYTKVDQRHVHVVNSRLSDVELASFATAYITAENMLNRAEVSSSDTILITGASGGVGSALIQLAKRQGAITIAMCSESKFDEVKNIGADYLLPRQCTDLEAALKSATGKLTVSVVADVVGGDSWPQLIQVIERRGRYVCSGAIAGPMVEFDLRTFYLNDLTFTGATIVPPGVFADLIGYIERGEIKPLVAKTFALNELPEAQQFFINKQHVGNVVIKID